MNQKEPRTEPWTGVHEVLQNEDEEKNQRKRLNKINQWDERGTKSTES